MNAVGIDVSKGRSMVAILRPYGEVVLPPFEVNHTASDINSLIDIIKSVDGESRIAMEHTGRYYEPLALQLSQAGLFVSAVNPKLIKDYNRNSLRKVKSDKVDAIKIARYALDSWSELKPYSPIDEIRNQLKIMNRQFSFYMKHKTDMKNNLIGILDQTYPGVNSYFDSSARADGSQNIKQAVEQLNTASRTVEELRALMNEMAAKLPEYPIVMAMKGVGPSLGPQLMAEIGDVTRFTHKTAITAFAGVDPGVNQSGSYEQRKAQNSKKLLFTLHI